MTINYIQDPKTKVIAQKSINDTFGLFEKLEPGYYTTSNIGSNFETIIGYNKVKQLDNLIHFSSGVIKDTINSIDIFLNKDTSAKYNKLKVGHKLGIILHGPPGTGKTSTVALLCNELIKNHNAIAINFTGNSLGWIKMVIKSLRTFQDNPIVAFVDEFECEVGNYDEANESGYLTFLDGSDSFNNLIFVACTNKLDEIPDRIKFRKSRIKHLVEIKSFPIEVYKEFILDKVPDMNSELVAELSYKAEEHGLTLDNLKHVIIDYIIEEVSFDDSIKSLVPLVKK